MDSHSTVGISLGELISVAVAIVGVLWSLGKIGLAQFMTRVDDRFKTIDAKLKTFDPLHADFQRVDKDLVQIRLEMATKYVPQEGLQRLDDKITRLFGEVFDKLDSKADKSECAEHHGDRRG